MLGDDVELAVGDFADRDSLERALDGVDALFLACGNVPDQVEYECAAIDAAQAAGVRRVVKLSGPRAAVDSSLLFERWHGEIERHLLALRRAVGAAPPERLHDQPARNADAVQHTGKLFAPAGDARIAYVDPRDVAAAAAATLTGRGARGSTYTVTGPEAITYEQIARRCRRRPVARSSTSTSPTRPHARRCARPGCRR